MERHTLDKTDNNIVLITKKYVIDMLNATMFSNTLMWDGIDQFNELPILTVEDDKNIRMEQRGALFLHRRSQMALRMVVTAHESISQRVCYRIMGIHDTLIMDDPRKTFYPPEYLKVDFSIADTNLGMSQDSAYSFSYNIPVDASKEKGIVFNFLRFLMDSEVIAYEDVELFKDMLNDVLSLPPVPGDPHFKPIYSISQDT
jgi:hypothetical protein